ncbi:hypothetical protein BGZ76_000621 [Entomortierella beljakovae]|nr:hypothetical protein BGZ76_000621 [Entomortierella beljakovae]
MTTLSNNPNTFIPSNLGPDDNSMWLNSYSRALCSQHLIDDKDWNPEMNSSTSTSTSTSAPSQEINHNNSTDDVLQSGLGTLSPGRKLSQMLCNIGFNVIDYFTSDEDVPKSENYSSPQTTSSCKSVVNRKVEDTQANVTYWAVADVYASRTGRRAFSRSSSLSSDGSWMDAMERLGHWEDSA